jgi:hypothetical protein
VPGPAGGLLLLLLLLPFPPAAGMPGWWQAAAAAAAVESADALKAAAAIAALCHWSLRVLMPEKHPFMSVTHSYNKKHKGMYFKPCITGVLHTMQARKAARVPK